MTFYIMGEPKYSATSWYFKRLNDLHALFHKKRIQNRTVTNASYFEQCDVSDTDVLLLFGTDTEWVFENAAMLSRYFDNRIIIYGISNTVTNIYPNKINTIFSDLSGGINMLYDYMTFHGKKKIALYGITPDAISDEVRKNSFLSYRNSESDIYYHTSSLEQCFNDFIVNIDRYDAVICANPYSAISLLKRLGGKKIFLACCGTSMLFELPFFAGITHTYTPVTFSQIFLDVYRMLISNRMISSINIYITNELYVSETTDYLPPPDKCGAMQQSSFKNNLTFYADREVSEMQKIELLVQKSDKIDLIILERILENKTYAQISDELYMSTNGIKYKLKKMFEICGVSSKNELCELLRKHINK